MNDLARALSHGPVVGDGAMGTWLRAADPDGRDGPVDILAVNRPDRVEAAHVAYLNAGSQWIQTHTFATNRIRLSRLGLGARTGTVQTAAARAARRAVEAAGRPAWILGSLGPTGLWGADLDDEAHIADVFAEQASDLAGAGVDGFIVETLSDPREWRAAMAGVRRVSDLPLLTTVSLSAEGTSRDGYGIDDFLAALLADWENRPDAFGLGCGAGPAPLLSHLGRLRTALSARGLSLPLVVQPNAGLPTLRDGQVVYGATPAYFGEGAARWLAAGAAVLGACCGTTPDHVAALRQAVDRLLERPGAAVPEEPAAGEPAPWGDASGQAARPLPARPAAANGRVAPAFWISVEVDPPKGAQTERMVAHARMAAEAGADAVNIADSPMARVRMGSLASAAIIERAVGIPTLLHFTTRDRNLMGIQADLLGAAALGLHSILALTGDPPGLGDYAHATAVYDLDAVGLLRLLSGLNRGEDAMGRPLAGATDFHLSAGVDPGAPDFAATVARTRDKVAAGAQRLLTQPVYEADVLERFLDALAADVPIILGVMPLLTARQADYLHNEVPGIRIPDAVRDRMRKAGDQGERIGTEIALDLVERLRPRIHGVYVVPSLGRMRGPLSLVRHWNEQRARPAARGDTAKEEAR